MAEGTREYKRLEGVIKECDQKRERDIARVDATLEEIKAMINGMTIQYNDIRNQMNEREGEMNRGSILGHPGAGESSVNTVHAHNFRYATKLEVPKFNGDEVEE